MNLANKIEIHGDEELGVLDVERDHDGVAHIVPVSGGKDSTCLALALKEKEPRQYTYVYTPTGDELPEMVMHIARIEKLLGQPIIKLTNGTLATQIEANRMLPNVFSRWCTRLLKLRPAGQFYSQFAPVICYVGIRDDEDYREGTRPGGDSAPSGTDVVQVFPFQEWGWGIDEVWDFLDEKKIHIPQRTDCARCPYQKLGEWYNLWLYHREIFLDAEADEKRYGHTFRSPQRDSWPAGLKELRVLFEAGKIPDRSLRMMEKRRGMCSACTR
ncbi:phosphoadenosine phosphosulfate reductase family protein [Shewanella sp.]|uniref:phosphoadenosine phosphosulfate reductase domain-containing protein n=1 Tax=Shewanella sp. TaxID=50422 RepID=UPI003D0B886A